MNQFKHASIIPLIGGFPIAASNVLNTTPEAIFSWNAFYNNDKLYLNYLEKLNKTVPYIKLDDDTFNLDKVYKFKNLDIVTGVPPCSGLSMSGNLKKGVRNNSPVNDWMIKAANFVLETLTPKVYVFENAPTLYTGVGDEVRKQLIKIAEKNKYAITFYKTDTVLHGIPQRRPRTYVIFYKGNKSPILNYIKSETPDVEEYLKSIPKSASLQNEYSTKEPFIKDFEIFKFCKLKFGDNWRQVFLDTREHLTSYDFLNRNNLLEEYRKFVYSLSDSHPASKKDIDHVIKKLSMGKNFRLSHRVLCIDKHHVYAVVGEMMERNVHPTEDRRMNIREYMHLMGLPHDFEIENPKDYTKLTQNVPVKTSEYIIREIVEVLKGNRQFSDKNVEMQNNITYNESKCKQLF